MLVSIYLPTKNRLDYLHRAIQSVLAQTVADFELIVVDDGSTDGTAAYLEQARRDDHRIVCVRNETSRGAPACRNRAIRMASGDIITGLDAADSFAPYRLEAFLSSWRLIERCGLATSVLYAQDNWFSGGKLVYTTQKTGTVVYTDMDVRNQVGNQIFAPRTHLHASDLFDETLPAWQDVDFFIRILKQFGIGRLVDVPSYDVDVSPRSDRISAHQMRVTNASRIVHDRYFCGSGRSAQLIALQVFSNYYGFRPTFSDLCEFTRHGLWPLGMARMMAARFRS